MDLLKKTNKHFLEKIVRFDRTIIPDGFERNPFICCHSFNFTVFWIWLHKIVCWFSRSVRFSTTNLSIVFLRYPIVFSFQSRPILHPQTRYLYSYRFVFRNIKLEPDKTDLTIHPVTNNYSKRSLKTHCVYDGQGNNFRNSHGKPPFYTFELRPLGAVRPRVLFSFSAIGFSCIFDSKYTCRL